MDIRVTATNSLLAVDSWLKTLAGNLTGSNVIGYKATRLQFADLLVENVRAQAPAQDNFGGINPIQYNVGGTYIKASKTDFSQASLQTTGRPSDLGITGDGFFVLSRVPNPTRMEDLVFSRNGSFNWTFAEDAPGSGPLANEPAAIRRGARSGRMRLVNQDGLFVLGTNGNYEPSQTQGQPGTPRPPQERTGQGSSLAGLGLRPLEVPVIQDPGEVDPATQRITENLSVNETLQFEFNRSGMIMLSSDAYATAPLDASGRLARRNGTDPATGQNVTLVNSGRQDSYVSLMKFTSPDGLVRESGASDFRYTGAAGAFTSGVAFTDTGAVGRTNSINPGAVETSNSSVNTTLPELTIAQKSFTASVKIVQVGNNLQDDLNQLIR